MVEGVAARIAIRKKGLNGRLIVAGPCGIHCLG
jgi:hypothetical protein